MPPEATTLTPASAAYGNAKHIAYWQAPPRLQPLICCLLLPLTPSSAWNCVFIASNRPHPIRFRVHPPFQLVFDLSRPKLYLPRASNEPSAIRLWTQPAHTVQGLPRHAYGGDDASCLLMHGTDVVDLSRLRYLRQGDGGWLLRRPVEALTECTRQQYRLMRIYRKAPAEDSASIRMHPPDPCRAVHPAPFHMELSGRMLIQTV
ncbi:hypothetical protein CMUS01_03474 [Colletotrichum musicola]|uniref:Uncharacterized protein n=1 Tax=Colletotrichum musicola TaxID=2175873 RepID=A0A8H6NSQ1_9PEZI|nr:hypothetical protein CMUS01_03474 [Colletotrichum musicola]